METEKEIINLKIAMEVAKNIQAKDVEATKLALDLKSAETERRLNKQDREIEELNAYKNTALGRGAVVSIIIPIVVSLIFLFISKFMN